MMRKKRRSSLDKIESDASVTSKSKKSRDGTRSLKPAAQQDNAGESVFAQLVRGAGIALRQGSTPNEIAVDQAMFHRRLQRSLRKHPHYPNIIKEFITGLESHIEDQDKFKNCLLPCVPRSSDGESSTATYQESLIKMLLGIEMLQSSVINTLFEKLPEFMYDGVGDDGLNIPRIIINQFKWLDRVMDSKDLANKLMQLVAVAPVEIQRDIISSLPEILEDTQHNDIARELNSLLQKNTQLTLPILDTLSSLNLSPALLAEVRQAVMTTLSAVELEDLPVVVKFILHNLSGAEAYEVICDLRKKLELESCVLPPVLQASQNRLKSKGTAGSSHHPTASSSQDCVSLVLDVIKSAVRFQKPISEAWLKAIENIDATEDHKVIDIMALLILHSATANQGRREVERLLRVKVRAGQVRESLLQTAFRGHALVMCGYFPSILALAQTLLRSPDSSVLTFGSHMYKHAFMAFDSYCQQEVVGSLVAHVCSGYAPEVDVSLELLGELVTQRPSDMSLYAVFIKGILDYMDNLTPQQIRRLFFILSQLAFGSHPQGNHIQDDIHIVIRKQLSSTVSKYKRIGIIGAVMVVGGMASRRTNSASSNGQEPSLSKEICRQVTALLELVRSCSEGSPEAAALYYDELANLVQTGHLDKVVQEWIGKSVLEDFQDDFVVDLGPEIQGDFPFPVKVMYSLDEEEESQGGIAVNLLPLLVKDLSQKGAQWSQPGEENKKQVSPLRLASFFRLLRLCEEEQHDGNLEEIDALIGCPLILTDLDVVDKIESLSKSEKEFLCTLLFYTINWFREVVNGFCRQKDPEVKLKVVMRLQNITYLQSILERCLAATPSYVPPPANFDCETAEGGPAPTSTIPLKKARKELGGKKRKAQASKAVPGDSSQQEEGGEAEESQQEKDHAEKEKEEGKAGVSLASFRPYFRELDIEVLNVLQCGVLSRSLLDSELHTRVREEVRLGPSELVFLLEDLSRKLEFSLAASPAKRAPFLKGKADKTVGFSHLQQKSPVEIAACCVQLLPTLCTHLENSHNYFQSLLTENQGVVDALGVDVKEYQLMASCYQLLIQVLHTTFSWNGFLQQEKRKLLKMALGVLAGRLKEKEVELSLEEQVRHSFEYLLNFRSSMPTCCTALSLIQLLILIAECAGPSNSAYREQLASLARRFLCQEWVLPSGERERGNKHNDTLQTLLSIYLEHSADVLKAIEEIAEEGVSELVSSAKDGCSKTFPTLNRQTFLVFYRGMMMELEKSVRRIQPGKQTDSSETQTEKLCIWNLAVRDFHILVNLVKVFDSRSVLGVCLKYGRLFVEAFLKLGMPLLDFSFKKHKEDVQTLLKTFQLSTRQLHHVCGYSKIRQDTGLTNHVPVLKKTLEQFVYRVKATLVLNSCQEAFWLGNLKNRDLQGEEILSQRSQASDEEDEQQVSQLPKEQSEEEEEKSDSEARKSGQENEESIDDSD